MENRKTKDLYIGAVSWIALNDSVFNYGLSPSRLLERLEIHSPVLMIADVFDRLPAKVAKDVIDYRREFEECHKDDDV